MVVTVTGIEWDTDREDQCLMAESDANFKPLDKVLWNLGMVASEVFTGHASRMRCEDLEKRVLAIAKDELCDKGEVGMGSDLVEDLGCDELDLAELHMRLEEEFDIRIEDDDFLAKAKTIQGIADSLKSWGCGNEPGQETPEDPGVANNTNSPE